MNSKKRQHEAGFMNPRKRDREAAHICLNCHHPYHTKEECFKPGGGLSHLTGKQRGEWLAQKRKWRMPRHDNDCRQSTGAPDAQEQQKTNEKAQMAMEEKLTKMSKTLEAIGKGLKNSGIDPMYC